MVKLLFRALGVLSGGFIGFCSLVLLTGFYSPLTLDAANNLTDVASIYAALTNLNGQPQAPTNSFLSSINSTSYTNIRRMGYLAVGDGPAVDYTPSGSACALTSGSFTGSISGTILTVSAVSAGGLRPGLVVTGAGISSGTVVTSYGTGTGGTGTYGVNKSQTIGSEAMTAPGDGGAQIPSLDGKCWNAVFPGGGWRIETWGLTANPITLYVHSAGSNANGNKCIDSNWPCLTWQTAANQGQLFDVEGGNVLVHNTDTSPHSFAESVAVTGPLRGAGNGTAVPNIGALDRSQIILDGNSQATITGAGGACYGVAASFSAYVGVENIVIAPTFAACQDGLFAQMQGGVNVYGGVTLGATGASGCKAHAENSAYGVQFWQNYTLTGNGNCGYSVGGGASSIVIGAGIGTITGNPTLSTLVYVSSGGVFQTNIANPWGGAPGAMSGGGFILPPGGTIENNGNAVAWPGTGSSFLEGGNYNQAPAPSASSDAGIGAGGTVVVGSGSTPYAGVITITTAGVPSSAGVLTLTFPAPMSLRRSNGAVSQCRGGVIGGGTGAWQPGAIVQGSAITAGAVGLTWQNIGVNLTTAKTYVVEYSCLSG